MPMVTRIHFKSGLLRSECVKQKRFVCVIELSGKLQLTRALGFSYKINLGAFSLTLVRILTLWLLVVV